MCTQHTWHMAYISTFLRVRIGFCADLCRKQTSLNTGNEKNVLLLSSCDLGETGISEVAHFCAILSIDPGLFGGYPAHLQNHDPVYGRWVTFYIKSLVLLINSVHGFGTTSMTVNKQLYYVQCQLSATCFGLHYRTIIPPFSYSYILSCIIRWSRKRPKAPKILQINAYLMCKRLKTPISGFYSLTRLFL